MLSIDVELQTMVLPEILGTNFNLTQHENYLKITNGNQFRNPNKNRYKNECMANLDIQETRNLFLVFYIKTCLVVLWCQIGQSLNR